MNPNFYKRPIPYFKSNETTPYRITYITNPILSVVVSFDVVALLLFSFHYCYHWSFASPVNSYLNHWCPLPPSPDLFLHSSLLPYYFLVEQHYIWSYIYCIDLHSKREIGRVWCLPTIKYINLFISWFSLSWDLWKISLEPFDSCQTCFLKLVWWYSHQSGFSH